MPQEPRADLDEPVGRVSHEVVPLGRQALLLQQVALSEHLGHPIGRRPRYYPALEGREDAIVMSAELDPRWLA